VSATAHLSMNELPFANLVSPPWGLRINKDAFVTE
jgi:hypothetical protein